MSIPQRWAVEAEDAVTPNAGFDKKVYFVRKGATVYQAIDSVEANHLCSELNRLDEIDRRAEEKAVAASPPPPEKLKEVPAYLFISGKGERSVFVKEQIALAKMLLVCERVSGSQVSQVFPLYPGEKALSENEM